MSASAGRTAEGGDGLLNKGVYSDDAVKAMLDAGSLPPIKDIGDKIAASPDAKYLTFAYNLVGNAPHFQLSWDQALPPQQATELLTNLSQVFLGQQTPQEFVSEMNATMRHDRFDTARARRRGRRPAGPPREAGPVPHGVTCCSSSAPSQWCPFSVSLFCRS